MAYKMLKSRHEMASALTPPVQPTGEWVGNLTVLDEYEALFYSEITSITGDLNLDPGYIGVFRMPKLVSIVGTFSGTSPTVTYIDLPALTTSANIMLDTTTGLVEAHFPVLTDAGWVDFRSSWALEVLDAPLLATVHSFMISDMLVLQNLNLPSLTTVLSPISTGWVLVQNGLMLESVSLPSLAWVGDDMTVMQNPALTTLTVTPSTFVNLGPANDGTLWISNNPSYLDTSAVTIANDLIGHGWVGSFIHVGNLEP